MSEPSCENEQPIDIQEGSAASSGALPPQHEGSRPAAAPHEVRRIGSAYHKKRTTRIMVDTTSDYNAEVLKQLGIEVIHFRYVGPDGEREDDLWTSQTPHEFYECMRKNPDARFTTEAVTPGTYLEAFENATTGLINVIYHRNNGGYGIIKPKIEEYDERA